MPKPPFLCSCGRTVAHGTPCACQKANKTARDRRYDKTRATAARRGYNHEWRKARVEFLKHHTRCARPGCTANPTVVDHIKPHKGDMALFWDRTNWQAPCAPCHSRHKQRQEALA